MKKYYILFLLLYCFHDSFSETTKPNDYFLQGFSIYPYFNEQIRIINFNPEVRVFINAPSPAQFNPAKKVGIALYALPNGNTIENTIGKILKPGDDWHYDIQHIGAQTRFLRNMDLDYNLVTIYLETAQKSWPSWRSKYSNNAELIKNIVDSMKNIFKEFNPFIILTGHSGGGSFTFGFMNAVTSIPDYVDRITFLDSDYNYDNTYGQKLINWINSSPEHYLCVIAYNDSVALYNGQPVVSPTGGTWYRSRMMATFMAGYYSFTTSIDTNFVRYTALNGRIKFILKQNPLQQILHTVQVELNGFIHGMLTGTTKESQGYTYYGSRAYSNLIQPDIVFPTPLNIPPRPSNAKTGSAFMNFVSNMTVQQRENEILNELLSGNVPDFLRTLKRINSVFTDVNGKSHTISYDVMPDYLAIGSNEDYCRIPMGPKTAQKIADFYGAILPTPKLVDDIYSKCEIKLAPVTYTPVGNQNELVPKFVEHNKAIDSQCVVAGRILGQLTGGTKKDVVLSNKITDPTRPNHVCIYGWHQLNGQPIQPLTNIHIDTYVDYSHGIRFLNREFIMDSTVKNMTNILKDAVLYKVLSNETGPMTQPSYFSDTSLPGIPKSFGFKPESNTSVRLIIKTDTSLTGCKVFISRNGILFNDSLNLTLANPVITNLLTDSLYFFKIKTQNSLGESQFSEVLCCVPSANNSKVLFVHGFDRASTGNTKDFIRFHASSVFFKYKYLSSCTNDAVIDGLFNLNNYQLVDYILGDESTVDETFSNTEQNIVKSYLQNGGNLLVSGAELAWDLDYKGTTTDKDFIWNYLKVKYYADAPNNQPGVFYQAEILPNNFFSGIPSFFYDNGTQGTIDVKYPDVLKIQGNSIPFIKYAALDTSAGIAGIYYSGNFPGGNKPGRVIVAGFPFECIYNNNIRNQLFEKMLEFFEITTGLETIYTGDKIDYSLSQNYPNPFNNETKIKFSISEKSNVELSIFDLMGKKVVELLNEQLNAGNYNYSLNASKLSSGIYFYKLTAGNFIKVRKLCLIK